ncbi:MAG: hypothetical protein JW839_20595 [Candidatus Lokiarchaeota archaeon]|nr:hypothetical protein [Candidatus Lokiarchaeota archaeon]
MPAKDTTLDAFLGVPRDTRADKGADTRRMLDLVGFSDDEWTFKVADTKEFTHLIFHEYPARMIPQVARKLINLYYPRHGDPREKKPMLDPFGGSGTSCVEAMLRNIDSIAFDLNPLAHLVQKVKTTPIDPAALHRRLESILHVVSAEKGKRFNESIPPVAQIDFWFGERVISDLSVIKHAISLSFSEPAGDPAVAVQLRNFFLVCLGKTARDCSYQRKGENKTYRMEREKLADFDSKVDPIGRFKQVARDYIAAMGTYYSHVKQNKFAASCKAILGNSMVMEGIPDGSIDLVVTSPPYGDSHTTVAYGQFSRFPLEWILPDTARVKEIDSQLLGGVHNDAEFPESTLLLETCKRIMVEQARQQSALISAHVQAIGPSDLADEKAVMSLLQAFIDGSIPVISSAADFPGFAQARKEYYSRLSGARVAGSKGNKWLDSRSFGKAGRFKVYDDRLGFVLSFFADFSRVLARLFQVLDGDRKCCLVVGNRTVKNVQIPTDRIMIELGEGLGFEHVVTYYRDIPNKRMPLSNSPSNVPGEVSPTMAKEAIVVLNKPRLN